MANRLSMLLLLSSLTFTINYGQGNDSVKCPLNLLKVDTYNYRKIVPGDYIIKTYSDMVDYWEGAFGTLIYNPLPNVYFSNQMVIVLEGEYGEYGNRNDVSKTIKAYETKDKITIYVTKKEPINRLYMSYEHWCTIISIKKSDKNVEIKRIKFE